MLRKHLSEKQNLSNIKYLPHFYCNGVFSLVCLLKLSWFTVDLRNTQFDLSHSCAITKPINSSSKQHFVFTALKS